jgi:tartrate-resistant acid phosphatase type 5
MNNKYLRFFGILLAIFGLIGHATGDVQENAKGSLEFIVLGDWGTPDSEGQKLVAAQMDKLAESTPIDFIVTTGDNFYGKGVQSVDDPLWESTFENVYSLPALKNIPWYVTLGNHDYMGNIHAQIEYGKGRVNWILPRTYYSKEFKIDEHASVLILFLDTSPFLEEYRATPDLYPHIEEQDIDEQIKWMDSTLIESSNTWRIAVGHHPVYSVGPHGDTKELKNVLPQLFEQQKVQAYFAGHDHHLEHYQLVGTTHYFISGGGSRPRRVSKRNYSQFAASSLGFTHVQVDDTCMRVRFINEEGKELYKTSIVVNNKVQCQ